MIGSGSQGDQRQPRIDRNQDDHRHADHQHVGCEVKQVQRQENVDAIGFRADARHQVAGAFAAEIFVREFEEMFVGGGTQVGTDTLGYQRQHVGAGPAQRPRQTAAPSRPVR